MRLDTKMFSSPFLGTFFQFLAGFTVSVPATPCFRPLSWGLSFNNKMIFINDTYTDVFVPFLGDFLSIWRNKMEMKLYKIKFSSPFLGTFFQSRACEAPARLLSQAHSRRGWGNRFIRHSPSEMKCRFSQAGRASAGICNEKIEMRNEKWWCGA